MVGPEMCKLDSAIKAEKRRRFNKLRRIEAFHGEQSGKNFATFVSCEHILNVLLKF